MRRSIASLVLLSTVIDTHALAAPPLWDQLRPRQASTTAVGQNHTLTQTNGPWLIMAASFTGEEGKSQAEELVTELRSKYHLPAFYYGMTFEMEDINPGRGVDNYGGPIKRRYNRGDSVVEHAVLVGEFQTIDDSEAQKVLKQIKQITPEALKVDDGEETAQSLAGIREIQNMIRQKVNPANKRGPMGDAFLTRNPMLPREYFVPQGVDPEVAKWNEGLEYSLLKNTGKYSIRVATFRGRSSFEMIGQNSKKESTKKKKVKDPLAEAAQNAHVMAVALRQKGWEAYEFHDRQESYVTVGSFDTGEQLADGRIALTNQEAQTIVRTFGAHTPNASLEKPAYDKLGVKPEKARQIEQNQQRIRQQFANNFSSEHMELTNELHPKRFVGLPFDIIPEPVVVPKRSISSTYVRN